MYICRGISIVGGGEIKNLFFRNCQQITFIDKSIENNYFNTKCYKCFVVVVQNTPLMDSPPSIGSMNPVIKLAVSSARKEIAFTQSDFVPIR